MYTFVNSKSFIYTWFGMSVFLLCITSYIGYTGLSLFFILTFISSFFDILLEHWYSIGVSKKLVIFNCLANALGIVVQAYYGLYGGMVTSTIGFMLLIHKTLTWDSRKDGKISYFKRQETTLTIVGISLGIVILGIVYGIVFRNNQPFWLVGLNVLTFILGVGGRVLLLNGKVQAQYLYIARELIDLIIFISMISLSLTSDSLWLRLASIVSSLIILFKSSINWAYEARRGD